MLLMAGASKACGKCHAAQFRREPDSALLEIGILVLERELFPDS